MNDDDLDKMTFEELEEDRGLALRAVVSFLAVLVILGMAFAAIWIMILSKPKAAKKAEVAAMARTVQVATIEQAEGEVEIRADGVVESQRVVNLTAEVTGKLIEVNANLVPGGKVREDEVLVVIDSSDYRAALEQAKATVERARMTVADSELAIEQEEARRDQSLRDWKKLGEGAPSDLLSRKPQLLSAQARLASARADVMSAEAEVERANRNLARTVIRAPFDAVVREESVEVGAVLAPGTMLATLFSERSLEVELPLTLEDYALLRRDEIGAVKGEVFLKGKLGVREVTWPGRIVRTTGEVERGALTASVVVAVEAADGEGELRLPPPGMFVQAELKGQVLSQAFVVPREAVREGDRVAIVSEEGKIEFRELSVVRADAMSVYTSRGVSKGEQVVLTRLAGAVEGMEVEVAAPKEEETPKEGEGEE